ncbi:MFS transporter [Kocuria palustris]|nr:MFS transporter [Kocuria palustris]
MAVALPAIMGEFHVSAATAQWLLTGFMLTMAVVMPTTGWMLERFSTRPVFIVAVAAFLLGTLLAALAPWFGVLLLGRLFQGAGTAVVLPLMMAVTMTLVAASGLLGLARLRNVGTPRRLPLDVVSVVLSVLAFGGPDLRPELDRADPRRRLRRGRRAERDGRRGRGAGAVRASADPPGPDRRGPAGPAAAGRAGIHPADHCAADPLRGDARRDEHASSLSAGLLAGHGPGGRGELGLPHQCRAGGHRPGALPVHPGPQIGVPDRDRGLSRQLAAPRAWS